MDAFPIDRTLRERDVQSKCVDMARRAGCWARKFSSPANRSVPDYLFAGISVRAPIKFAVEFKAPGKTSTDAQREEQEAMRTAGWDVYECDSVEKFRTILAKYCA